jgi:hypothetical protein
MKLMGAIVGEPPGMVEVSCQTQATARGRKGDRGEIVSGQRQGVKVS